VLPPPPFAHLLNGRVTLDAQKLAELRGALQVLRRVSRHYASHVVGQLLEAPRHRWVGHGQGLTVGGRQRHVAAEATPRRLGEAAGRSIGVGGAEAGAAGSARSREAAS